jgi:hypothetical protein
MPAKSLDDVEAPEWFLLAKHCAIGQSADQVVEFCCFHSGILASGEWELPGKPIPLGTVPPIAFSEAMRRLLRVVGAV